MSTTASTPMIPDLQAAEPESIETIEKQTKTDFKYPSAPKEIQMDEGQKQEILNRLTKEMHNQLAGGRENEAS